MDSELLELELENAILNGGLDAPVAQVTLEDDTQVQLEPMHHRSASNVYASTSQEPQVAESLSTSTPPMRNPSRERLKRELGFLREYAIELEAELSTLRAPKRSLENALPTTNTITTSVWATTDSPWKCSAETERKKRMRSEHENQRLRHSLETQLRVAEELSLFLRERAAAAPPSTLIPHEAPTHIPPLLVSTSFNLVVAHLLCDIDRAYAVTSSVFTGPSYTTLPNERVFVTTVKTRPFVGVEQLYIELMDTAYRSHPYERTCEAAWEATRVVYASASRVIAVGPCTDDVIAVRYRTTGQTRRGTAKDLLVTFVVKKFVETDRTVLVWRTCDSPAVYDRDMPLHAVSDETGWMLITKVSQDVANRAAGTAFFQACSRLVPAWLEGDVADSSVRTQLAIGEFTNVVLSATEADVTGFETAFQRLVLEEAEEAEEAAEEAEGEEVGVSDTGQWDVTSIPEDESEAPSEAETLVAFV